MHQTYSTLIKRDTDWLDFSILNRTTSVWFYQHSNTLTEAYAIHPTY